MEIETGEVRPQGRAGRGGGVVVVGSSLSLAPPLSLLLSISAALFLSFRRGEGGLMNDGPTRNQPKASRCLIMGGGGFGA